MKLSEDTLNVLKNFSTINPSLLIKPGKTISTVSPNKTIMAVANTEEHFNSIGGIYEVSRFLGVLSLFQEPVISFELNHMEIKDSKRSVNYTFADPSMIVTPPEKEITFPDPEVSINIEWTDINNALRASGVMQLPEIVIMGDGSNIAIGAMDSKNPTADIYNQNVGTTTNTFKFIFKVENLKLIDKDYAIEISTRGIAKFSSLNTEGAKMIYWVATEANSSFGV
jgi:hypothetical protein